jgi:hypothetical protein
MNKRIEKRFRRKAARAKANKKVSARDERSKDEIIRDRLLGRYGYMQHDMRNPGGTDASCEELGRTIRASIIDEDRERGSARNPRPSDDYVGGAVLMTSSMDLKAILKGPSRNEKS